MRKLALGIVAFLAIINTTADVHADAADVFNRSAPALSEQNAGQLPGEWVYVRKADGSLWYKSLAAPGGMAGSGAPCGAGGTGGSWSPAGIPPVGPTTSGPQVGWTSSPSPQEWIFAETASALYVRGFTWNNVSPPPPGGFTSGLTVASDYINNVMHVAARGGSNILYVMSVNVLPGGSPLSASAWTQVGTTSIASAPAIASPGYRRDVLSLNASTQVQITSCFFPTCWSTPAALPGPITSSFSPFAHYYDINGTFGGPFMVVATNASGNATISVRSGPTWGAPIGRGGGTINGPVAVSTNNTSPLAPRLAAHFSDGSYRVNCSNGTTWINLGQP